MKKMHSTEIDAPEAETANSVCRTTTTFQHKTDVVLHRNKAMIKIYSRRAKKAESHSLKVCLKSKLPKIFMLDGNLSQKRKH